MALKPVANSDILDVLKDRRDAKAAGISDQQWETISKSRDYQNTRAERKRMGMKRASGFAGATDQAEGTGGSSFFRGIVGKPLEAITQGMMHGGNRLQRAIGMDPNAGLFGGQGMFSDANVAYADAQPKISAAREAAARQRQGRTGHDWWETAGSLFTPSPAGKGHAIVRGATQGLVGAALDPVTDTSKGYGAGLAKNLGVGAGTGAAISTVFGLPGRILGKEAARVAENVAHGQRLGVDLGLAEASHSRPVRMVSDLVGNTIVGSQIPNKAEKTLQGLDRTLSNTADEISGGAGKGLTAFGAGQTIKTGLTKAVDDFKAHASKMYDAVDASVPAGTKVGMRKVAEIMKGPGSRFASNPALGEELANPRLKRILSTIQTQTPVGRVTRKIDFNEAQELRSHIGKMIGDPQMRGDIPTGDLKQLYSTLTSAMGDSLGTGTKAKAAWDAADAFYKAGSAKIDNFIEPAIGKAGEAAPEAVTQHVLNAIRKDANAVKELRSSVHPDQWDEMVGHSIRDLGLPTFANRTAENEGFSLGTFLTNYNKLRRNPEAFDAAFKGTKFEANKGVFDDLASLAENIKRTGDLANKSRSGYTAGNYALISSLFTNPLIFAKLAGGTLAASHALSSPKVARGIAAMGRAYVKHGGKGRVLNRQLKQMAARLAVQGVQAQPQPQEQPQQ